MLLFSLPAMNKIPHPTRQGGMTLVELMVGLVISLFLAAITTTVFVSSRTVFNVGAAQSRMSENARLAMELMKNDLRHGGFMGCHPSWPNTWSSGASGGSGDLSNAIANGFLDTSSGVQGYEGGSSSFTPSLPSVLTSLTQAPIASSDVISIRVPVDQLSLGLTADLTSSTDVPNVGANALNNTFKTGDIALISNCQVSTLFAITDANPVGNGTLTHNTGGSINITNQSNDLGSVFHKDDTAIYRMQTHHYFIAPSAIHTGVNSLWMYTSPDKTATEVATGIDNMSITYGVDTNNDQIPDKYVTADLVTSWDSVITARVTLTISTNQTGVSKSSSDSKLRNQVTQVLALRNHAP